MIFPSQLLADKSDDLVCPRFAIRGNERITLSETEKRLVCGDPRNEAWDQVPDNQAIFSFKNFLQDRGFYSPEFTKDGNRLIAILNRPTDVSEFSVVGDPKDLPVERFRGIVGSRLTPTLLDEVQNRVVHMLQSRSYPCAVVEMSADPKSGKLTAKLKSGPKLALLRVEEEAVPGMNVPVFSRYDAFRIGDPYNADYLTVTVNRIMSAGLVDSAHFTTTCEAAGAVATQRTVAGPPRLLTVGFGINTERVGLFRATWKNNRWGDAGSQLTIAFTASSLEQQLSAFGDWYYIKKPTRHFLRPSFNIRRQNFLENENYSSKLQLAPALTLDRQDTSYQMDVGPNLNLVHTTRGPGPVWGKFLTVSGDLSIKNHYYEYYQSSPRAGYSFGSDFLLTQNDALSNVTARLIRLNFDTLWNLLNYDPPLLVFGLRGTVGTTHTPETYQSSLLPDDFRHFLGGRSNVRGFYPRELPGTKYGALTSASASFEVRLADKFLFGLQPFVFIDGAIMGSLPFSLDSAFFYSPGGGIRWQSPIGVVRTTFAHGFIQGPTPATDDGHDMTHPQFYFTLGEEF